MIEELLETLKIQEIWESIVLQFNILFDPETSFLGSALKVFFEKVLNNPLASIITLLALVGLPYTLFKAKQSNTEADERLDQLIDEMKDFEFEKPLIDLQEKFKGASFDNSPVINYDHDVLELNFEKIDPEYNNQENTILADLESTSFVKQITLDQEITDDFLSTGTMKLESELNDEPLDFSPLTEETFDETEVSQPGEFNIDKKEFADFYSEAPEIKDQEQDLVSAEKEIFDTTEASPPVELNIDEKELAGFYGEDPEIKDQEQDLVSVEEEVFVATEASQPVELNIDEKELADFYGEAPEIKDQEQDLVSAEEEVFDTTETSPPVELNVDEKELADFYGEAPETKDQEQDLVSVEEEVFVATEASQPVESSITAEESASPETDDLKTKMELAIQKLKGKYTTPEEENDTEPAPSVFKKIKKTSRSEESKGDSQEDASPPSSIPTSSDSRNGEKKNSLKKSHVITHLNSFQKNLENQLNAQTQGFKKKSTDRQQEQISSFETILKPTKITCPPQSKTTDEEYQQALESFLFLRDQKKTE